jgi:malate permease and related proteins
VSNILLLFLCLLAGVLLRKVRYVNENSHLILNDIIMYICLPALALLYIPRIKFDGNILFPLLSAWIVFGFSIVFFLFLKKFLKSDSYTLGALILTAGLCNTSFVGFPVLMALYGEEGLKTGVLIDQSGSFVILATVGIIVASICSHGKIDLKVISKKILYYPSFAAFVIGIILNIFHFEFTGVVEEILQKAGSPMAFLALISVGLQLRIRLNHIPYKEILSGLFYKLILAPLIIYVVFVFIMKGKGLDVQVSVIEMAMPPMVMGSVLAVSYNLNPRLANLMVGIGIPLSFITIFIWYFILNL